MQDVTCKSEEMRRRILPLLARAKRTVKPLTDLWQIQPRVKVGNAINGASDAQAMEGGGGVKEGKAEVDIIKAEPA